MESFLEREYADFQKGGDAELYSATKQQAAVKKNRKAEQWKTENPLILRDDVYDGDRQQAIGI